jgi:hypothetical protein
MRFKHFLFLIFLTVVLSYALFLYSIKKTAYFDFKDYNTTTKIKEVILPTEKNILPKTEIKKEKAEIDKQSKKRTKEINNEITGSKTTTTTEIEIIILDVPFTSQAPLAEWNDPRQQDGCEEAAALMAVRWARGQTLTRQEAKEEILAASKYEQEMYGEYRDASATDTAERIIKGYFGYEDYEVKKITSAKDIITELRQGRVTIVPMHGQKLKNPFYTQPGPERHMLVICGYDFITKEFITNDNGTRKGEKYRYPEDIFYEAIRDYPTGYHVPIEQVNKVMIIVKFLGNT